MTEYSHSQDLESMLDDIIDDIVLHKKDFKVWTVWMLITTCIGAILLIVGLHVNWVVIPNSPKIPKSLKISFNWDNADPYSIYNLPPMFSKLPSRIQGLAITGIIGSVFMYFALICFLFGLYHGGSILLMRDEANNLSLEIESKTYKKTSLQGDQEVEDLKKEIAQLKKNQEIAKLKAELASLKGQQTNK